MSTQKKGERKRDKALRGFEALGEISLGVAGVALAAAAIDASRPRTVVVRETVVTRPRYSIFDDVVEETETTDMWGNETIRRVTRRGF